jgi:DNA polymerase V
MKIVSIKKSKENVHKMERPLFQSKVNAGFPSPAEDYIEKNIDLNDLLISNPPATYFIRVEGDSMTGSGIYSGDVLVVDKSKKPKNDDIVVAVINSEFTVKKLKLYNNQVILEASNPKYPPIVITEYSDFQIWGVVQYAIHKMGNREATLND